MAAQKRIRKELTEMEINPPAYCSAGPVDEDDLSHWKAIILGPNNSPFTGGTFELEFTFPKNYPFEPLTVKFMTKIFHPNISKYGTVCIDILKEAAWSPAFSISKGILCYYIILYYFIVLMCILSLMTDPNPDDAFSGIQAELYKTDREQYNKNAKDWTAKYAM